MDKFEKKRWFNAAKARDDMRRELGIHGKIDLFLPIYSHTVEWYEFVSQKCQQSPTDRIEKSETKPDFLLIVQIEQKTITLDGI